MNGRSGVPPDHSQSDVASQNELPICGIEKGENIEEGSVLRKSLVDSEEGDSGNWDREEVIEPEVLKDVADIEEVSDVETQNESPICGRKEGERIGQESSKELEVDCEERDCQERNNAGGDCKEAFKEKGMRVRVE